MMAAISSKENLMGPSLASRLPAQRWDSLAARASTILRPEGLDAASQLDGLDPTVPDGGDERRWSHAGGPDRVSRI